MEKKVKIKNLTGGQVVVINDDLKVRRTWERRGAVKTIDFDVLEELIYDPGVEYMFKQGILGIEDLEVKKALGLEPEDATEPVNIITFDDKKMDRLMTVMPLHEFKAEVEKAPIEQVRLLVEYAVKKEYTDFEKCEILKSLTQVDVINAIKLNRAAKEEVGPITE